MTRCAVVLRETGLIREQARDFETLPARRRLRRPAACHQPAASTCSSPGIPACTTGAGAAAQQAIVIRRGAADSSPPQACAGTRDASVSDRSTRD